MCPELLIRLSEIKYLAVDFLSNFTWGGGGARCSESFGENKIESQEESMKREIVSRRKVRRKTIDGRRRFRKRRGRMCGREEDKCDGEKERQREKKTNN